MKYLIFFLLLVSMNAYSNAGFLVVLSYKLPVERMDNSLIGDDELSKITIYEYNCATNERIRTYMTVTGDVRPGKEMPVHYMYSMFTPACYKLTVTDSDGRDSDLSAMFKAHDFRTAKPVECLQ